MHLLKAPLFTHQFGGEPVEENRMSWALSEITKVIGSGANSPPKVVLPEAIHDHPGGPGIVGFDYPLRERQSTPASVSPVSRRLVFQLVSSEDCWDLRGHDLFSLYVGIPAVVHVKRGWCFAMLLHNLSADARRLRPALSVLCNPLFKVLPLGEEAPINTL